LSTTYDYIIAGSGCAGLSLLMRLLQEPQLNTKKILVLDQSPKTQNDRTWCFWEKNEGLFEPIVHHRWQEADFFSNSYSATLQLSPYVYKMIRGIDFYEYVISLAKQFHNVEFKFEPIKSIVTEYTNAVVITDQSVYQAAFVFNSILFGDLLPEKNQPFLLQHFKGWLIETPAPCFDTNKATLMDFTVSQEHQTTFMYVLPIANNRALVEYTLFNEQLLEQSQYDQALNEYIALKLHIDNYKIVHSEFGIIPMTAKKFAPHDGRVINIGIAGGQVKGSSGYAFQFIQKRTQQIVQSLVKDNHPFIRSTIQEKKFRLFDKVLLNVLFHQKLNGDQVFAKIFQKNTAATVLRFLDNESSITEDLRIMKSVPTNIFLPTALYELFRW